MIDPVKTERLRRVAGELIDAIDAFTPDLTKSEQARLGPFYGPARTEARDLLIRLDPENCPDMPKPPEPAPVPVAPAPVAPTATEPVTTFREWVASDVLTALAGNPGNNASSVTQDAELAVRAADALIAALKRGEGPK